MITRPCPHCETGWRRADELVGPSAIVAGPRLVPCPTCQGSGRVMGDGETVEFLGRRGEPATSVRVL